MPIRAEFEINVTGGNPVMANVIPMNVALPEINDNPLIQADDLRYYISRRMKAGDLDLYSAFLLSHESVRIGRIGYLQSAWGFEVNVSGLFKIYMNGLTATAFGIDGIVDRSREWLKHDMESFNPNREHFFTTKMRDIKLFDDMEFLKQLCEMRTNYDNLSDDDGPYHNEFFPWHYAEPEREVLHTNSTNQFIKPNIVDPHVENLIVDLNTGKWG